MGVGRLSAGYGRAAACWPVIRVECAVTRWMLGSLLWSVLCGFEVILARAGVVWVCAGEGGCVFFSR